VKPTAKEMIPDRDATDAHTQDFVAKDESVLFILKTFTQYSIIEVSDTFSSIHALFIFKFLHN
jgi:hypothetical protein